MRIEAIVNFPNGRQVYSEVECEIIKFISDETKIKRSSSSVIEISITNLLLPWEKFLLVPNEDYALLIPPHNVHPFKAEYCKKFNGCRVWVVEINRTRKLVEKFLPQIH